MATIQVSPTSRFSRIERSNQSRASSKRFCSTAIIPRLVIDTAIAQRSPMSVRSASARSWKARERS